MYVEWEDYEFLPVNDPISGEDQKEKHETWIAEYSREVFCCLPEADRLDFARAAWLFEKQQHREEHHEYTQCSRPEHVLHSHMLVYPGRDIGSRRSAYIHQRVIN